MVFFNWATMQMAAKIVYYGPGLCGKTSNLSFIYAKTSPGSRGEMVSLETESDRTLFFDLLPIEVGTIGGFKTRLQLYTVPGQVFYNTTRKLVLKGVDGIVFVADSQRPMREANLESFASLGDNLKELGLDVNELPLVLQFNKRDLKNVLTPEELNADLNPTDVHPFFEASAINGDGVFETLKEITKLTLKKLRRKMAAPGASRSRTPASTAVRPSPAAPQQATSRPSSISAAALARAAEEGVEESGATAPPTSVEMQRPSQPEPAVESHQPAVASTWSDDAPPSEPVFEPEPEPFGEATYGDETSHRSAADAETPEEFPAPAAAAEVHQAPATGDEPDVAPFDNLEESEEFDPVSDAAPAPSTTTLTDEDSDVKIEFATDIEAEQVAPPPMKRVQVSNQMDILAELDGLRKQATMAAGGKRDVQSPADLDLESLLGGDDRTVRELRRRIAKSVNSDIFQRMHGLQFALRIQDAKGDTIHTLDPVSLIVEGAPHLKKLCLQVTVDLENLK
jgi:hypothetical protein